VTGPVVTQTIGVRFLDKTALSVVEGFAGGVMDTRLESPDTIPCRVNGFEMINCSG
jgi:hypothetical protein